VINEISKYYQFADDGFANLMFLHCDGYSNSKQSNCRTYDGPDTDVRYSLNYNGLSLDPITVSVLSGQTINAALRISAQNNISIGAGMADPEDKVTIHIMDSVEPVGPRDWPLGDGPHNVGFSIVTDIPISHGIGIVPLPTKNKAIIYYPSKIDGQDVPPARTDGPFCSGRIWSCKTKSRNSSM